MLLRTIIPPQIKGEKYYVYAHILENGTYPFYIGIGTVQIGSKYQRAKNSINRNKFWKNYTKNTNYLVVICSDSGNKEETKEQEKELISILGKKIDDKSNFLVNISDGGDGCKGYKHTTEHIEQLKERYSGINNPMYGRKASEATKLKMSKSGKGRKHTEYTKKLLSIKKKERGYQGKYGKEHPTSRGVYRLSPIDYSILEKFDTIRDAAKKFNVCNQALSNACRLLHRVKGYNWMYINEYNKELFFINKKVYKKDIYKTEVCADFKGGLPKAAIARKYNIGETTCNRILMANLGLWQ
jgi:group I intron endonuclease